MSSLHEEYPNIPLGTPFRDLVHTELGVLTVRGAVMNEKIALRDFAWKDRTKGLPHKLIQLEIEVADWAFAEQAAGHASVAELLEPEPGFLLPRETRRRLREMEGIALRTEVYSRDLGQYTSYYRTARARNPTLGGEVADYVGVEAGQSAELALGTGGDVVRLSRSVDGQVELSGLGDYLAERGDFGGEVWLEFFRDRRMRWSPVGFWFHMDGELWEQYEAAVVRIDLPGGAVEVGAAPGLARSMGMQASAFGEPMIGQFPLADDARLHIITAYNSTLPDGAENRTENRTRNAELLAGIEALGATWYPAVGADRSRTHQEPSFAVLGLTRAQAIALGWKYRQDAIFEWTKDYWALVDCRFGYVKSMRWECRHLGAPAPDTRLEEAR